MRWLCLFLLLGWSLGLWAQDSSNAPSSAPPAAKGQQSSNASQPSGARPPTQPPRSDRVRAEDLGDADGTSSSKETQIDLSSPVDDAKVHPQSTQAVLDAELGGGDAEVYPWDPHKAAKNVEVGDYYFKRQNYHAAESRYREALLYKPNDAIATYRLAVSLEKLDESDAAQLEYQNYLKILPHGPEAENAKKAINRLSAAAKAPAAARPAH
jgi:Flp pilus assembly protein TadD